MASLLFEVIPINSQSAGEYDPWIDINDDGKIDMKDVGTVARAFGASGTPINKTELLLELQDRVSDLAGRIAVFNTTCADGIIETVSKYWEPIPDMKLHLTINRTCFLRVTIGIKLMFNCSHSYEAYIKVLLNSTTATPMHILCSEGYNNFDYYLTEVPSGKYVIEAHWCTLCPIISDDYRYLIVEATPLA